MRTSDNAERQSTRSETAVTPGLTAVVTLVLLALAWLIPLETRGATGERREMSALSVWHEMLRNLPDDAPFFLNSGVMTVLSIVALIISAYILVAVARLPR
jgi:hypothetical protein